MIAERQPNDYSSGTLRAESRRLRLAAYYTINREAVRGFRIRKKMTQDKLRRAAGVSKQTITRMESGPNVPQFDTIEKVAAALGVSSDDLIVYHTPTNEAKISEAQTDWERRNEGDNDAGDRGA